MGVIGNGSDSKSEVLGSSPSIPTQICRITTCHLFLISDENNFMIEAKSITTNPGIYCFRNSTNNKCYIGQAINIRKRFSSHIRNFITHKLDNPLYRAFSKYTLDVFEFSILEVITENLNKKELKNKLDFLEKKYIKEYDSYKNGYNQTLGGDYGILGYKFTKEQVEKNRQNIIKITRDGRFTVLLYDTVTKESKSFLNMSLIAQYLNTSHQSVTSAKAHKRLLKNRYLIVSSQEEIQELLNYLEDKKKNSKYSKNGSQKLYAEYWEYLQQFKCITIDELSEKLGLTKNAIYKRNSKLRNLGYKLNMIL